MTAQLPLAAGQLPSAAARLHEISYEISAADIDPPLKGTMNLVGTRAQALALQVPSGAGRIVRADGWDENRIRLYAAQDTFDLAARQGQEALLEELESLCASSGEELLESVDVHWEVLHKFVRIMAHRPP